MTRRRRLRKDVAHLEITAFINLIVVLVPFLLSTAVFTRLAVMDMSLPAQNNGGPEQVKGNDLQLEVVMRKETIEINDRIGGRLTDPIARKGGADDFKALQAFMVTLKTRFPDKREANLLAEPETPYDDLVQAMEAMRATVTPQGPRTIRAELFPNISIGDAPVRGAGAKKAT